MPCHPINEGIMQVDDILSTNFLIVIYRHNSRFQLHSFFVRFPSNAHLHFKYSSLIIRFLLFWLSNNIVVVFGVSCARLFVIFLRDLCTFLFFAPPCPLISLSLSTSLSSFPPSISRSPSFSLFLSICLSHFFHSRSLFLTLSLTVFSYFHADASQHANFAACVFQVQIVHTIRSVCIQWTTRLIFV